MTASAFDSCVSDATQLKAPHQLEGYVRLVPTEMSSDVATQQKSYLGVRSFFASAFAAVSDAGPASCGFGAAHSWKAHHAAHGTVSRPTCQGAENATDGAIAQVTSGILNPMAKRTPSRKSSARKRTPRGIKLLRTLACAGEWPGRAAWSPNGELLACGNEAGLVQIWGNSSSRIKKALRHEELRRDPVPEVAWSFKGTLLAAAGERISIWDTSTWERVRTLPYTEAIVVTVAWSPKADLLAAGDSLGNLKLWNAQTGQLLQQINGHDERILCVAWSPDGTRLASCAEDKEIRIWDLRAGQLIAEMAEHAGSVYSIAWSPDGQRLASASKDRTIKIWDTKTFRQTDQLEGHTAEVHWVSFSPEGTFLASKAADQTVRLWRCDTWDLAAIIPEGTSETWPPNVSFHPSLPILATGADRLGGLHIWEFDPAVLRQAVASKHPAHYANAKVVLVGNTGVGKSGLGFVLATEKYRPTDSTHGRHVWTLSSEKVQSGTRLAGERETLLWDLAGQPGYRLIHQLHLNEVAVALVLFDSQSEIEPFAGVSYWAQALDQATKGYPLVKFLVSSRSDRGGVKASRARIDEVMRRYGFSHHFETSAKSGSGVQELRQSISASIQWDKLPKVSTTELFRGAKSFLIAQKKQGLVIARQSELFSRFSCSKKGAGATEEVFATCLAGLESAGLVKRLSFGSHVLLQPEMLDAYCGWMAAAAREQPDGLGFTKEDDALNGNFKMDDDRPLKDKPEEKIMLLAMTQEVITRNIAQRQATSRGTMLVFPSELNAELPDYPGGYSLAVRFRFRGPISGIYATLAVTLLNSMVFEKKRLFKNAALFVGPRNQVCGFAIEYPDHTDDALGQLTVFFEKETATEVRLLFLRFVNQQLKQLALDNSMQRERVYHCPECDFTIPQEVVNLRKTLKASTVACPGCLQHFPLHELDEIEIRDTQLQTIDAQAAEERERQARLAILEERKKTQEFHLFLCHNSKDKPAVRELATALLEQGVLSWMDEKGLLVGDRFPEQLEEKIDRAPVVAVVIGPHKLGRWQTLEYYAALQRSVEDRDENGRQRVRLIPVLLPGATGLPSDLPPFLRGVHAIDLRKNGVQDREEVRKLVRAIFHETSLY